MNDKMLALYGLKWNPFTPNVPTEALHVTTRLESFCWRRLAERLRAEEFLPLASRMRVRLAIERAAPQDLQEGLQHALRQAGAPTLMTPEVIAAICDHAQGNLRTLMIMAADLLDAAAQREARQIDETLFFETFAIPTASASKAAARQRR